MFLRGGPCGSAALPGARTGAALGGSGGPRAAPELQPLLGGAALSSRCSPWACARPLVLNTPVRGMF